MPHSAHKKYVIIGGGIAGVSLAIKLHRSGLNVVLCERDKDIPIKGNAFLMHADGLTTLQSLSLNEEQIVLPGKTIDTFLLKNPDDIEVKYLKMEPWQCIKRKDIVDYLYKILPHSILKCDREFSHFIFKNKKAVKAVFKNGETESGDVFIGADGARSTVREQIFESPNYSPVEVREVVGIALNPQLIQEKPFTFNKFLSSDKGLSFGYIPTSDTELVWFMQYDVRLHQLKNESPEELKKMCYELLKNFPEKVKTVLDSSDFKNAYLWHARDFDILPTFHQNNIVLIGDAAHLALPFTSAGTTNALIDAKVLGELLVEKKQTHLAFKSFYKKRVDIVREHLELGREIKESFLNPNYSSIDDIKVPLITHQSIKNKTAPKYKKVNLLYFTDPICSTCWLMQPQLRKMIIEYSDYLEIDYCMGGLLPSWENYGGTLIKNEGDAYNYWESLSTDFAMPINPDVWKKDPLLSSFPPSIAFKAAQIQDREKAIVFLRRLNEQLFVKGNNISNNEIIIDEAYASGLDIAKLLRDIKEKAKELFEEDLKLAKELYVKSMPTFIFTDRFDNSVVLKGIQSFDAFEKVMKSFVPEIADLKKQTLKSIFNKYNSLTSIEYAFLRDISLEDAEKELEKNHKKGIIEKKDIINDRILWVLIKTESSLSSL
jgi:2-polyprenyl-6-methoxyphenol hydroxylase-like FAD-dependent oxidoreductase/predicted DsbA family dithiol-disulfide isomerase